MSKAKNKLFFTIMIVLIVGVPISVGELFVRILSPEGIVTPETVYKESLEFLPSLFSRVVISPEERIVKTRDRGVYHINKHGYRGRDFAPSKPEGVIRIVFLGGSQIFDIYAKKGQDWPHLVERNLREAGYKDVEVINAGVPGYASWDVLGILYAEVHNFQPDYVVVCNAWNDIKYFRSLTREKSLLRCYVPMQGKNPFIHYNSWLDKILCSSQLYVRLRYRYYAGTLLGIGRDLLARVGLEGKKPEGNFQSGYSEFGVQQYELNLETIIDVSRNIGAVPVLLTQARLVSESNTEEDRGKIGYEYQVLAHDALVEAFDECDEVVRKVAREKGAYLVDLSKYNGRSDLFHDHTHTTAKGSRIIARTVADSIMKIMALNKKKE